MAEFLRLVWLTNRFSFDPPGVYELVEPQQPVILAFWHGQHFLTPFIKTKESHRAKVLISRHRDGETNAIAAERLGIETIRGSGDHGSAFHRKGGVGAFKEMVRALAENYNVALTADVPKRSRVAGLGIIMLAREFGTADHALRDSDQPIYPPEQLGPHHHQFAVRAGHIGRHSDRWSCLPMPTPTPWKSCACNWRKTSTKRPVWPMGGSAVRRGRSMAKSLPMALRIYRKLSSAAVPLTPALIKRRLKQGKEDPARIGERRGMSGNARPPGPLVWIHGASVGEVLAAAALIERLSALNIQVLLTSGTVTSAAIAAKRFPDVIHQYVPYDSPRYVARFLDHWRPSLALFVESDLWPNLILSSAARRLPMVLINGRMSHRSFPRWRRIAGTISALLGRFDVCLAQSPVDAERFAALGSRNVVTTGNLKLDVPAPPADPAKLERLMAVARGRPIIVAASTHAGEEEILLQAHRALAGVFPSLLSVIVPRHADRGEAIAAAIAASGAQVALRSREELPVAATEIYVADTMGELGLFYRLAPIVFMGGSLVRHGGQNPIEAVKLGASIVHGPHVFNFADVYEALDNAGGARQANTPEALVKQLGQLLADPAARKSSVAAAERVVVELGGALDRTLMALEPYLLQLRLEMGAANA